MFALIDGNNFFVSCERVFRPDLQHKPVAVLSNNDGCIIARSNEVKSLGVPMGAPLFKYRRLCQQHGVQIFSANFQLYGDMSNRMFSALQMQLPSVEVYSIDEAFAEVSGINTATLLTTRNNVLRWTGLPTSIGVAPTKTLAKIANHIAKKYPQYSGVFSLEDAALRQRVLRHIPVGDIWGVGANLQAKFHSWKLITAADVAAADPKWLRSKVQNVMGEKLVLELRGIPCFTLEQTPEPKKQILASRSFGKSIANLEHLQEAVASYTTRAGRKLRQDKSVAQGITVFIKTNRFRKAPYVKAMHAYGFDHATDHTGTLIHGALDALKHIYVPHLAYHKAGVMLWGLEQKSGQQYSFFEQSQHTARFDKLTSALDRLNSKHERTVFYGATGIKQPWQMKNNHCSPRYTTRWTDLPRVV